VAVILLAAVRLAASDFWDQKNFTAWSDQEVRRILTDSPWSRAVTIFNAEFSLGKRVGGLSGGVVGRGVGSRGGFGGAGGGVGGDGAGNLGGGSFLDSPERFNVVLRWTSALPVRQAIRRRQSLEAGTPAEPVSGDDEPFYRVAIVGLLPTAVDSFGGLTLTTSLNRRRAEPIPAVSADFTHDGDLALIEFSFPRTDAITVTDQEVEFVTKLGQETVRKKFKLKDMIFQGRLAL
jgi:hypothetical protein